VRLVDAAGAHVVLPGPARRVVSLVPSASETLRAMGAEALLIGRTDFDTAPWAARLPSVGGGIEPNLEALVALEPDLVVRFAGEQDPRTPERLDALGIAHIAVRPDRVEDIYVTARLLGRATGHGAAADSLEASIRAGLAAVAGTVRGLERLRVAYVLGGTPPWVAGPGTYIDEIVSLAGGDNVFADLGALYSAVSPEELRIRDIDVVLLSAGATFDRGLTPGTRVELVGDALEIPGPDVVDAAHRVAELLHGRSEQ
jgi:iron complex transport system substrate-binding protein